MLAPSWVEVRPDPFRCAGREEGLPRGTVLGALNHGNTFDSRL